MIEPDWGNFRAKFKGRDQQDKFEWFCKLLFCKEFKKPLGVSSYINQSAIETEPITNGDDVIGFQSKFYDTRLSTHKSDFVKSIKSSKEYYPNITKLILYTNQKWGKGKIKGELEKEAESLGITIEWRTGDYFESDFVCIQNEIIAKHFFRLEKSIFYVIEALKKHTANLLEDIRTQIIFAEKTIKIDRDNILSALKNSQDKTLILSGAGGTGKTAIIKNLFEQLEDSCAFYVFKATEFELKNINELIDNFELQDFIDAHKDINKKIIVIDSAEKLLDINNTAPFKEFLKSVTRNNWQLIFTTRDNYLENLNSDFFEFYNIKPTNIRIENLKLLELQQLAEKNSFLLPTDEKILELIRNPFYLKYLKFYKPTEQLNIVEFKSKLWNEVIRHNKPAREQCFLQIALKRANEGQFFVKLDFDINILDELSKDEILGYETAGYFITHDIYEEWALEKIIETAFIKKSDNKSFFECIGQSLPIRRSFRKWLSDKLLLERELVKYFIEDVIDNKNIASFWHDEILVSVLLSDYSEKFFDIFTRELLKNDFALLIKMNFLLRLACKEIDTEALKNLTGQNLDLFYLKFVLTKPKGQGWNSLIHYVFQNVEKIGYKNINFVLPIIYDWNSKFKQGETTRLSSLIALKYYEYTIKNKIYWSRDESKKQLLQTILYGCNAIKPELKSVFDNVIKNNWKQNSDPYYDLSKMILTTLDGIAISIVLPQSVLQLANLFWTATPKQTSYYDYSLDVENDFGLERHYPGYFPASAYQTPIYWILQASFEETIDFILDFTNKAIEFYSLHSKYKDVNEVVLSISDKIIVKQYHSNNFWLIYRTNSSAPYLLQSIHMALEKFLLEKFKDASAEVIESWLVYLLKESKSSSISAIVTSIVLAYPDKTFNMAVILFKTKEFFYSDFSRQLSERDAKPFGYGINYNHKLFEEERMKTCDDKHRKFHLENLFLHYQVFRNKGVSEAEVKNRQTILWQILDDYYAELSENKEDDKTWQICLARIDTRKMDITTKATDKGVEIYFNPKLEPELKEYSEETSEIYSEQMKYTSLSVWSSFRRENNQKYKDSNYQQYENTPSFAIQQIKEIFSDKNQLENICNRSVPANVCAVLIRDFFDAISAEEAIFCKDILLQYAALFLQKNFQYQVGDGIEPAFSVLSILLQKFPDEKYNIKQILLFSLFNKYLVNQLSNFNASPLAEIDKLWQTNFDDAQSILLGYLLLHQKYIELGRKPIESFYQENKNSLQKFIDNKLSLNDIDAVDKLSLETLKTAFQLIPNKTENLEHKTLIKIIVKVFTDKVFFKVCVQDERKKKHNEILNKALGTHLPTDNVIKDDKISYEIKHDFIKKLSSLILSCKYNEIQEYLERILDDFCNPDKITDYEIIADLFKEIIYAEDHLNSYENFWEVWNLFKPKIIEISKKNNWHIDAILKSYLFSQCIWKETAVEWHTFKDKDKRFFKEITTEIGHHPAVLYAMAKILNGIGSCYLDDGIAWISAMLSKNKELLTAKLEDDTIYYLEHISKKYIYKKRDEIKRIKQLKTDILVILDFLIDNGSVVGYMLRENIL